MAECKMRFKPSRAVAQISRRQGTLIDAVYGLAVNRTFRFMQLAWSLASQFVEGVHRSGKMPFNDVTGNLYESIGFALIGKSVKTGQKFALATYPSSREGFSSTRPALGKGEAYDLADYADGTKVSSIGKPYIGETDRGKGMRGRTERGDTLERIKAAHPPSKTRLYNIVAFAAMPYASYVNMKQGREFFQKEIMTALRDAVNEAKMEIGR